MLELMHTENIYHPFLFFGFMVALLFTNHSGDFMYYPSLFNLTL